MVNSLATIGEHLAMGKSGVAKLLLELGLSQSDSVDVIRVAYIKRLREKAAGRAGTGSKQWTDERIRLSAAKAEKQEMENALHKAELAPRALLEDALGLLSRQVVTVMEGLPGQVRLKRHAGAAATPRILTIIREEIEQCRRLAASIRFDEDGKTLIYKTQGEEA